jgi:invasion protein IalB
VVANRERPEPVGLQSDPLIGCSMKIISVKWILVGTLCAELSVFSSEAQQRTTATYDEWTVSCVENQKVCEITSSQQLEGQSAIASQITISGLAKDKPARISIQIPPNAWIASGIKLTADEKDTGIAAAFRWCVPSRCLADVEVKQDILKKLADLGDRPGNLVFQDATQHDQKIPFSFKGLGQALLARPR